MIMVVFLPTIRYLFNKSLRSVRFLAVAIILLLLQAINGNVYAQMRQIFVDVREENAVKKISFYSASQGYVAFTSLLGFTADSGRTFTRKYITYNNVDFGNYNVNLTFGFGISGIKAFNKDTLIVYGDYGAVPAILYSTDQGNTFKLIYQSQLNTQVPLEGSVKDMVFPTNRDVGYAVEADRIIKTVDRGKSWSVTLNSPNSFYDIVEAVDDNTVFAFSTYYTNKLMKTTNGGTTWLQTTVPTGTITHAHFISASKGWLNMNHGSIFYTSNGGAAWQFKNDYAPFYEGKMKFINDSIGYATGEFFRIYKTTDSGKVWEPLPRDNSYEYQGYGHYDLSFWNNDQFWAGGGHGFLEITTNGGGIPLPKAFFKIDTTNLSVTGIVKLANYSKSNHQYLWYKNDTLLSTNYHTSYNHKISKSGDTIKLVVLDGIYSDTAIKEIYFNVPPPPPVPTITSFTPAIAPAGRTVTITGTNLTGATSVSFGGIPAGSFSIISSTTINAVVGNGATGKVSVITPYGTVERNGFTFIPAPVISAFTPGSGSTGATITITGSNFNGATAVSFGGIPAASFAVLTDATITAVLGAGGSGNILVTTPGGTTTLPGFIFNYPPAITDFTPLEGSTGAMVTVKGSHFTGALAVNFGGAPVASFSISGDTSITAVLSTGASGAITITSPYGTGRSTASFTYVKPPTFDSFSPNIGGAGTRIVINGTSVGYATSVTIGGVPAQSISINNFYSKITAVVGAGATGDIVVTTPYGTVTKGSFTFYPLPVVSSINPTIGTAGTEITIIGRNFDSVLAIKFGGVRATSFKVNSKTVIKAIIGEGNSGAVSVTTPGGTGSGSNFTFVASPAPTITSFIPTAAPAG
jgi:large repetitive protein